MPPIDGPLTTPGGSVCAERAARAHTTSETDRRFLRMRVMVPSPARMNPNVRGKLFLMMVLEFFIWGAWYPPIFGYLPSLGFSPSERCCLLSCFPVAAIVGMFFRHQFADRTFAA